MNSQNKFLLIAGSLLVIVVGWLFLRSHNPTKASLVGALSCADGTATCLPALELTGALLSTNPSLQIDAGSLTDLGTFQLGTAGTAYSFSKSGTCTILANVSVAATSTSNFDCAFTGVVSGDTVMVEPQASSTLASQYVIRGAQASSTSGFITFSVLNLTGAAAVPAATVGFGSTTRILIFR